MEKMGLNSYGVQYNISADGNILTIIREHVILSENDVIELYVYKYIYESS